jgi:hypothetical protein
MPYSNSAVKGFLLSAALLAVACSGDGTTAPTVRAGSVSIAGVPADGVLLVGASQNLSASVSSDVGAPLVRPLQWSSTNAGIASVSASGVVVGVSAGAALIVARADAVADTVLVSVRVPIPMTPAGAAATTTTVLGGAVALTVPPGAGAATQLTVAPAALLPIDDRLLSGAAFDFGPSGATFTSPITMSLRYNDAAVPAAKRPRLRIHRVEDDGSLTMLPGGVVDQLNSRVSAPVSSFSTYALVVPADVASLTVLEGNSQAANVGSAVQGLSVIVRDAQQRPVPLVDIGFSVQLGGGRIEGGSLATTGADGVATLPGTWIMGPTKGQQVLRATIVGDGRNVLFTATAVAPAVGVRIQSAPTAAQSGITLNPPLVVQVVDVFGDPVNEIGRQVTASLLGGAGTLQGDVVMDAPTGSAIFQNMRIAGAGEYRIVFSSGSLVRDTTDVITLTQQLGSLAILTAPAGAASGQPFATQPVIELRDNAGLRMQGSGQQVIASAVHGPGAPIGGLSATAVAGVATFSGLGIEGQGTQQLRFSVGNIDIISGDIVVGPAPPGVWLRVTPSPTVNLISGQGFAPDLLFDLSNSGGANLATVQVTVTWDTARVSYGGFLTLPWRDASGADATVTADESQVGAGILVLNGQSPGATTASFSLGRVIVEPKTVTTNTRSVVGVSVNTALNAAGASVPVNTRSLTLIIDPRP